MSSAHERALHQRTEQILARMRQDRATAAMLESLRTPAKVAVPAEESRVLHEKVVSVPLSTIVSDDSGPATTLGGNSAMVIARSASAPTQLALTDGFAGRLVRADEANLNGALFTRDDLNFGLASLAMAPVTYNHVGDGAVGWIQNATPAETPEHGYHISISGRLWTARFPYIGESFADTLASGEASLSMECMAAAVACLTPECSAVATSADDACPHILERSGERRMMYPTFYGAAVILDGVKPGWPGASLTRD